MCVRGPAPVCLCVSVCLLCARRSPHVGKQGEYIGKNFKQLAVALFSLLTLCADVCLGLVSACPLVCEQA